MNSARELDFSSLFESLGLSAITSEWNGRGYSVPCADCKVLEGVEHLLSGHPAVPGGATACFCDPCFNARLKEYDFVNPPDRVRPLGVMTKSSE